MDHDAINETGNQIKGAIAETAKAAKDIAADAGDRAQSFAREVGKQARAAVPSLYGQGGDLVASVERVVGEYPLAALLLAGAVGYGVACALNRR